MTSQSRARLLTEILSEEHEFLLRALDLFCRYAEHVTSQRGYDPRLAREFLHFFRDFGDHVHHAKEESILFEWLGARGLPLDGGPLGVLRQEHEVSRDLRLALSLAADLLLQSPGDPEARVRFRDLACRYVELMTAHIAKEEQVLFPLANSFALQTGTELLRAGELPAKEFAWLASVEARAVNWPRASLSLQGLGTPYGFECLCEAALAVE